MINVLQENFVFSGLGMDLLTKYSPCTCKNILLAVCCCLFCRSADGVLSLIIRVVNSMRRMEMEPEAVIVEQGSLPSEEDCMFVLEEGVVDIVIAGGGQVRRDDVLQTVEGHTLRIQKGAGWVFGDMTLLLNTPRSASVHASTKVTLWTISKSTFLAVMAPFPCRS